MKNAKSRNLSRRNFMKQAGAAAVSTLPLFHILKARTAHAATAVAPLRMITMWYPWHVPELYYHPQNSSGGFAAAGTSFNLNFTNSVLAPLSQYQSKLLIFRGLGFNQGPSAHASNASFLTGAMAGDCFAADPPTTKGSSIEQYLFTRMAQSGSLDPIVAGLQSYVPDATYSKNGFGCAISWRSGNAQLAIDNPQALYKTYFSNFSGGSSGGNSGGTTDPVAAAAAARRAKTLSFAQGGLNNFLAQLSANSPSTPILQQHQSAIAGILAGLNMGSSGTPTAPTPPMANCSPPSSSSIATDTGPDTGNIDFTKAASDFTSFSTLISEAFACDITRFASIKLSATDDALLDIIGTMPALKTYAGGNWHNNVSHACADTGSDNDVWMAKQAAYWHGLLAQLMAQLQSIPDPYNNSQTLLDNTVIIMGCEGALQVPGSDVHNNGGTDQPFIVAGGCGGMFHMGQLIDARPLGKLVANFNPPANNTMNGIAHNALLTNIINAFETNQKAFNTSFTPKILTQYGDFAFPVSPTNWLST